MSEQGEAVIEANAVQSDTLSPLAKAHLRMAEMRAGGWKPVHLDPVEKARANPGSLKMAIRAFCWMCNGGGADPGVRFRVRDCGLSDKCTLWPHRPWQNAKGQIVDEFDEETGERIVGDPGEEGED